MVTWGSRGTPEFRPRDLAALGRALAVAAQAKSLPFSRDVPSGYLA